MYENIKSKYKQAFEKRLQIATYFCSTELTEKNCLDGVKLLSEASKDQDMRMKPWGEVSIEKYNTFIKDDFDGFFHLKFLLVQLKSHLVFRGDVFLVQPFEY